jgi:CO dehydrogenase maturation factor
MATIIAIAGKGGVGKSTFSSLLIRNISNKKEGVILAVDADSNSTLAQMLGVDIEQTIGDLRENLLKEKDDLPPGMSKQEYVSYQLQLAMSEGEKFDLVTMGRPEGPGCYCYINNILRTYMDGLVDKYKYVVIDNEAGMEHLSRRTTREMDKFFIITDYSPIGFETAERIIELSSSLNLKIKNKYLIINRVPNGGSEPKEHPVVAKLREANLVTKIFYIPNDDKLLNHVFSGKSLLDLPNDSTLVQKVDKIIKETEII